MLALTTGRYASVARKNTRWLFNALLVALVAACAAEPPTKIPEPAAPIDTTAEPAATVSPEVAEPEIVLTPVTIMAVGDMMIGTDFPENRLPDDDAVGFFDAVRPLLQSADVTFGNLEGVLLDGGKPAKRCSNPAACYLFRSPTRYAEIFAAAGFDALSLANNHARDFGEEGRDSSMAALDRVGIQHSGREGTAAEWTVDDKRVAMIAFAVTRESNSMLEIAPASAAVYVLAERNDIVIVSFHGGAEGLDAVHLPFTEETYYNEPRGDVVRFARAMVDAGADLVLGHGPHVVRAMELYSDRLIAYSLGNFATYYGISVAGIKGVAPILEAKLSGDGVLLDAKIHSTHQIRPAGPSEDAGGRALRWIQNLTRSDFGVEGVSFDAAGRLLKRDTQDP